MFPFVLFFGWCNVFLFVKLKCLSDTFPCHLSVVPNMEKDNLLGEGGSDTNGESVANEERSVPEKRPLDPEVEKAEPLRKSEPNISGHVCVSACLSAYLLAVACCVCT